MFVTCPVLKKLHRIHRKTCSMGFSIGLRLPVLDINHVLSDRPEAKTSATKIKTVKNDLCVLYFYYLYHN